MVRNPVLSTPVSRCGGRRRWRRLIYLVTRKTISVRDGVVSAACLHLTSNGSVTEEFSIVNHSFNSKIHWMLDRVSDSSYLSPARGGWKWYIEWGERKPDGVCEKNHPRTGTTVHDISCWFGHKSLEWMTAEMRCGMKLWTDGSESLWWAQKTES